MKFKNITDESYMFASCRPICMFVKSSVTLFIKKVLTCIVISLNPPLGSMDNLGRDLITKLMERQENVFRILIRYIHVCMYEYMNTYMYVCMYVCRVIVILRSHPMVSSESKIICAFFMCQLALSTMQNDFQNQLKVNGSRESNF